MPTEEWQNTFATATAAVPTPSVTPYPMGTLTPVEKGVVREVTAGGFNSIRKLLEARLGVKIPKGTIPDRVLGFLIRQGSRSVNPMVERLWSETKRGMVESAIHRTEQEPGVQAVRRMQERTDDKKSQAQSNNPAWQDRSSDRLAAGAEYHPYPNIWTYAKGGGNEFEASEARSPHIRPPSRQYSAELRDIPDEVRDDFGVHTPGVYRTDPAETERDYLRDVEWGMTQDPGDFTDEDFDVDVEKRLIGPNTWKAKPKEKKHGQTRSTSRTKLDECEELPTARERKRCRQRQRSKQSR